MLNLKLAFLLGLRNLSQARLPERQKKSRLLLPIISIALSLVPVVVILEVSNGMIEGITARYLEFESGHLSISFYSEDEVKQLEGYRGRLLQDPNIKSLSFSRRGGGLLFFQGRQAFVAIRAVEPDLYETDAGLGQYLRFIAGCWDLSQRNSLLIGQALAEELKVSVGDSLILYTHQTVIRNGKKLFQAKPTRLVVSGIYTIGYQELDKATIFISLPEGKRILTPNNANLLMTFKVKEPFKGITEKAINLERQIETDLGIFLRVYTWQELNSNYYNAFASTKAILIFIMLLIVFLASFNILSAQTMLVIDHLQEIAILKSIGASPTLISLGFVISGFLAGSLSTLLGLALGLLVAVNINEFFSLIENILNSFNHFLVLILSPLGLHLDLAQVKILNPEYYLEAIPLRLDVWEIITLGGFSLAITVFFSLFPAIRAGRIRPLEVIRKI